MSLDRSKLQKVRPLGNGAWQAQCPACAETGQDRKGEHLRISPEGKFGCCVFAGDREHRRRIFVLAGNHGPRRISVRVATGKAVPSAQQNLLGRLGRVFGIATEREDRTGMNIGTLGTGTYSLRVREETEEDQLYIHKLIDNREPVPSVPTGEQAVQHQEQLETGVPSVPKTNQLPYLLSDGTLVIPFNSPERYHWWTGGQSIRRTLAGLMTRKENDAAPF